MICLSLRPHPASTIQWLREIEPNSQGYRTCIGRSRPLPTEYVKTGRSYRYASFLTRVPVLRVVSLRLMITKVALSMVAALGVIAAEEQSVESLAAKSRDSVVVISQFGRDGKEE